MGVCGYTYDQVNSMPIDALARAIGARNKFVNNILRAVLGAPEEPPAKEAMRPMTPDLFDVLFPGRTD